MGEHNSASALTPGKVDVPSHIEEELGQVFGRLDVSDVEHPYLAHIPVVSRFHLLIHQ